MDVEQPALELACDYANGLIARCKTAIAFRVDAQDIGRKR